jgi:hypothetical protein
MSQCLNPILFTIGYGIVTCHILRRLSILADLGMIVTL